MKNLIANYRIAGTGWVNSVRERFDCDKNDSALSVPELWLMIVCFFSKEFLNLLIQTFSPSTGTLARLCGEIYPLNIELFWVLVFKLGLGYAVLIYLNYRHRGTETIWKVWAFWGITVFSPLLSSLESRHSLINALSHLLRLSTQVLFFVYFFALDTVHLDSLKLIFYEDLTVDELTGRIYRNPRSRISARKLQHLALYTCVLIGSSLALIVTVSRLIEAFGRASKSADPSGSDPGSPRTKNQQYLEEQFKINPLSVAFHALVVAPILEESVYRRFIMHSGRFRWWTIPLSGFIFGLIHLKDKEGAVTLVPYILPGIVFASGMYVSRNIWHSITAHAVYNTLSMMRMIIGALYERSSVPS